MTEQHDLDAARVAELQKQLNEASAQVAKVQSELQQATGNPDGHPIVIQGGPVDLTQYVGAQQAEQIRKALSQFGLDDHINGMFGGPIPATQGAPVVLERLSEPPRGVPIAFHLAVFSWSWWELFGILMWITAPIALWGFFPVAIPAGFLAGLLAIVSIRGRKHLRRMSLLKWGKVATVTNADELSRGTYYSGTTYSNMIVPQAHGWDVTRDFYSGPASVSEIHYTLDGQPGVLKLRGLPYASGVILANSRKPTKALCVSQFPYSVKPDGNGNFVGRLRARTWVGIVATMLIEAALVFGATLSILVFWIPSA